MSITKSIQESRKWKEPRPSDELECLALLAKFPEKSRHTYASANLRSLREHAKQLGLSASSRREAPASATSNKTPTTSVTQRADIERRVARIEAGQRRKQAAQAKADMIEAARNFDRDALKCLRAISGSVPWALEALRSMNEPTSDEFDSFERRRAMGYRQIPEARSPHKPGLPLMTPEEARRYRKERGLDP